MPPSCSAGCPRPSALPRAAYAPSSSATPKTTAWRFDGSLPGAGPRAVPSATALAVDLEARIGDRHRVLELDEAALGVLQRGLDRDHHAGFERPRRVVGVVTHPGGQTRRLMAHQAHAVRQEVHVLGVPRLLDQRIAYAVDHRGHGAGLDRLHGGALDHLDLAQQVLELRIRLAEDGHAAEIADVAVIVGARVEGDDIALGELVVRRGAVEAGD